ncbi:MAG: transposase [Acidiferrobacterales bacterium]
MEKLPRQMYSKEYREQAVKLLIEQRQAIPAAARNLSMSALALANWCIGHGTGSWMGWASTESL